MPIKSRLKNVFGGKRESIDNKPGSQQYPAAGQNVPFNMGLMQNALPHQPPPFVPMYSGPPGPPGPPGPVYQQLGQFGYGNPGSQPVQVIYLPVQRSPQPNQPGYVISPTASSSTDSLPTRPIYYSGPAQPVKRENTEVTVLPVDTIEPEPEPEESENEDSSIVLDLNMRCRNLPDSRRPKWYRNDQDCAKFKTRGSQSFLCATCRRIDFLSILLSPETKTAPPPHELIVLGPLATIIEKFQECGFCSLVCQMVRLNITKSIPDSFDEQETRDRLIEKIQEQSQDMYYLYPVRFKTEYGTPGLHLGRNVWQKSRELMNQNLETLRPDRNLGIRLAIKNQRQFGRLVKKDMIDVEWIKEKLAMCDARSVADPIIRPFNLRAIDVETLTIVDLRKGERYVTLSYVWGQVEQLSLTKEREQALRRPGGLAPFMDRVPQTIRDAIELTRNIGEKYLWVDALCIIQDDQEDKANLIGQMGNIYSDGVLTIQVCCGTDAHFGIPGVRPGTRKVTQVLSIVGENVMTNMLPGEENISASHWSSRAWTLQEKMLSRRMLMISEDVTYWWCWHTCTPEDENCRHQLWPEGTEDIRMIFFNTNHDLDVAKYGALSNFDMWAYMMSDFTKRNLTFQGDALNALQGILGRLRGYFRGKFLFGLPDTEFDNALLWCPIGSSKRRIENGRSLFPSWSFLGWSGHAAYPWAVERNFPTSLAESPLKWKDASDEEGEETWFTGASYRLCTVFQRPPENFNARFGDDEQDSWCWTDKTEPSRHWFNPIVGEVGEPRVFQHLAGNSHQLRLKTLSAHLTLAKDIEKRKDNYNYEHPVYQCRVLDSHGFSAGYVYTPDPDTMDAAQRAQFTGRREFLVLSRSGMHKDKHEDEDYLYTDLLSSALEMGMPPRVTARMIGVGEAACDELARFDNLIYYKTSPWCLLNVMMIERREDGVAERISVGRLHVSAFMFEMPEMMDVRLE